MCASSVWVFSLMCVAHLILWLLLNNCCWENTVQCYKMSVYMCTMYINITYTLHTIRSTIQSSFSLLLGRKNFIFSSCSFISCTFVQNAWLMRIMLRATCDKSIMATSLRLNILFFFSCSVRCSRKNTAFMYTYLQFNNQVS